jgi:hypothetical protein
MFRKLISLGLILFPLLALHAQDEPSPPDSPPELTPAVSPFPLTLLLESVRDGGLPWRPDWPLFFPPDGFTLSSGKALAITLRFDGDREYRVSWDRGLLTAFPFFLEEKTVQVRVIYRSPGEPQKFILEGEPDTVVEILEYRRDLPCLARISMEEGVCFAVLGYGVHEMSETWYREPPAGADGTQALPFDALAFYVSGFTGEGKNLVFIHKSSEEGKEETLYHYDSQSRMSALLSPRGSSGALYYREGLPRYWNRAGETLALQWDERGLLVNLRAETGDPEQGEVSPQDIRYEYTLDWKGNWTERREIRWVRRFGVLFPAPGLTVRRTIVYAPDETP